MLVSDVWQGLVPTVAFCLSLLASPAIASKPKNAILLSSVQSITLRAGKQTTHRRVPAVPQLTCVSSPEVCALHEIDIMRCTNEGTSYDAEDIQWSCTANLPPELKLGSTDVICEGYSSKNDPYVLKGSCAVEYRTVLTDYGRDRFPDLAKSNAPGRIATFAFYVIFISTLLFIIWSAWRSVDVVRPTGPPRRPGWGPGGGGGDWGDDDPPSPYYPPKPPSAGPQQQEGWRPGFWTGLAGGAAAGYAAGRNNNNNNNNQYQYGRRDQRGYGGYGNYGYGEGSGSGGGMFGSTSRSGTSSARRESTGFGSTRRR